MSAFYDSQNNEFALGERIGSGGEGAVYACADFNFVAKIYHEPITDEKAEKLRWMAANKNEKLLKVAAWVVDVLLDKPNGKVVGFTMPNVKAKEIHELYSLKSRRVHFPEATWHFLIHAATNVARAFYSLHGNAHVMGDVNHGNCVVLADGTVKLIDCDSYSISRGDFRYRCEVGVATHLAPELQGKDLSSVERETKHDNFGLAVIIFQLFFLGRHPFAGNFLGAEDKSIEDCIRELRFAYGDGAEIRRVRQPPGTLPLKAVSPRVATMFERAFLTEDRPEPREWIEALEDLLNNLKACDLHPGHLYFNELNRCPWCEIEAQTGLMLFPFVTAGGHLDGEKTFNIFTVESLIASFGLNGNALAKPLLPNVTLLPSKEIVEAKKANRKMMFVSIGTQFFGLIFLTAMFGAAVAFCLGFCALICWIFYINNNLGFWGDDPQQMLVIARREWEKFQNDWHKNTQPLSLENDLAGIKRRLADYQKFQQASILEAKNLHEDIARRELFQHLRSKPLAEAEIENFAEPQRQILTGNGIKTAAEINENRLRGFKDFDGAIIPKLIEWRNRIEHEFADAPRSVDLKVETNEFVKKTARERRRLETEIEHSLTILRAGAVNVRRRQQEFSDRAAALANRYLQSKSDAAAAGTTAPIIIALVLLTILLPYMGFIIGAINQPRTNYSAGKTYSGSAVSSAPSEDKKVSVDVNTLTVPDENITDAGIEMLSDSLRTTYADNLYVQAWDSTYKTIDFQKAEQKLRLAVRLQANDVRYFNQLGYVLYAQEKYTESLKVLNRALAVEKDNGNTQVFIGINYLRMKRFNDARQVLSAAAEKYPNFFEAQYNLGLAYSGLKNYVSAAEAMRGAVDLKADDADAHYQLGFDYYKLGDKDKAKDEYLILLGIDENLAEQLRKAARLDYPN